jgi:hypothetical protein
MKNTHLSYIYTLVLFISFTSIKICIESAIPSFGIQGVHAAEITDVIDAADGKDPFDFTGDVMYRRHLRRAKVTREYNCYPSMRAQDFQTCPYASSNGQIVHVKELRYQRWTHEMVPRARFGLYKDLELVIEAPIVIHDEQSFKYAGNGGDPTGTSASSIPITAETSSIVPSTGQQLFNFNDHPTPTRAGFGDMLFMLRFAPISFERDQSRGEWVIEAGYRAPTGTVMKSGNNSIGRGLHEVELATSFSRKYKFSEPYMSFRGKMPFASSTYSLFKDYWGSLDNPHPGLRADFDMGVEFIPYEKPSKGQKFYIDLGLGAGYQGKGRDYSEFFDVLALGARDCDANNDTNNRDNKPNCAFYNQDARSSMFGPQAPLNYDGITTVEQFLRIRGHLGFGFYVSSNFKIAADFSLAHDTEHYISSAEIGKDIYAQGDQRGVFVPATNDQQRSEHNPAFVPNLDYIGRRIRIEETTIFTMGFNMSFLF